MNPAMTCLTNRCPLATSTTIGALPALCLGVDPFHDRPGLLVADPPASVEEIRWRAVQGQDNGDDMMSSFTSIRLGQDWYVLDGGGLPIRIRDGVPLPRLADPGSPTGTKGAATLANGTVALSAIATPAAVGDLFLCPVGGYGGGARKDAGLRLLRLAVDGQATLISSVSGDPNGCSPVAVHGHAYLRGDGRNGGLLEIDLRQGAVSASVKDLPEATIGLVAADGVLVATREISGGGGRHGKGPTVSAGAKFTIYAIPGLTRIGGGRLEVDRSETLRPRWIAQLGQAGVRWGFAHPAIAGNRLFIRSNDTLYGIGR